MCPGISQVFEDPFFRDEKISGTSLKSMSATSFSVSVHGGTTVILPTQSFSLSVSPAMAFTKDPTLSSSRSFSRIPLTLITKGLFDFGTFVTNASVVGCAVLGDSVGGGVVGGTIDAPRGRGFFRSWFTTKLAIKMPMSSADSNSKVSMMQKQFRECVANVNIVRG